MPMRRNISPKLCCVCKKAPLFNYGRCTTCFRAMDPTLFARLKKLSRAERAQEFEQITGQPALPRWTYEGDEDALAELVERQEREQARKSGLFAP
jgi:hypothetical protein